MKKRLVNLSLTTAGLLILCGFIYFPSAGPAPESLLRQVLLTQLKKTRNEKDWFVPVKTALDGLTADQALWNDKSGNHSIGQLAYHLTFWNQRQLEKFRGAKTPDFTGNNDETFTAFDKAG